MVIPLSSTYLPANGLVFAISGCSFPLAGLSNLSATGLAPYSRFPVVKRMAALTVETCPPVVKLVVVRRIGAMLTDHTAPCHSRDESSKNGLRANGKSYSVAN